MLARARPVPFELLAALTAVLSIAVLAFGLTVVVLVEGIDDRPGAGATTTGAAITEP